jgi:protease I
MAEKRLAGSKILMVIAPDQFRDEELLTPKQVLSDAGAEVTVASTKMGEAKGMLGASVSPDIILADAHAKDYHAVIVVGGMGSPQYLWHDQRLHALVKEMNRDGKVVAAICLSGAALANAGVLAGKRATVWSMPESIKALKDGKAQYVEEPVVQDGKIITADGPSAAQQFAETIVAELSKVKASI